MSNGFDEDLAAVLTSPEFAKGPAVIPDAPEFGDNLPLVDTSKGEGIGLLDRLAGGFKFDQQSYYEFLKERFGADRVQPVRDKNTGNLNFMVIGDDGQKRLADPKGFELGDIADVGRDIGQAGGAGAGAALGFAFGGPPGALLGGIFGDAAGEAASQYIGSEVVPGEEDVSMGERLVTGGAGVALGAIPVAGTAAKAVGRGALRGAAALGSKAAARQLAKREVGRDVAKEAVEQSVKSMRPQTVSSFFDDSLRLQQAVTRETGEEFALTAGEATGSKKLLGIERMLSELPETADKVALVKQRRLSTVGKFLDKITDKVAANPGMLDNPTVGEAVAGRLDKYIGSLIDARSAAATPIYEAAEKAMGGARIIPTGNTVGALNKLIKETKFNPSGTGGQLRSIVAKISEESTKTGRMSVADMQNLRSLMGKAAAGKETIIESAKFANQRRIATKVLRAIDADLDQAAKGVQGEAAQLLQKANSVWREHSQSLDGVAGMSVVKRILKLGNEESGEKVIKSIEGLSRNRRRSLFKVLHKADPAAAKDLAAQMWQNVLEAGGRPQASTAGGRTLIEAGGESGIEVGNLKRAIIKRADLVADLFAGNPQAMKSATDLMGVLNRLSSGPGWKGSPTQNKQFYGKLMGAYDLVGGRLAQRFAATAKKAIDAGLTKPETLLEIVSTPEGAIDANKWLKPLMQGPKAGRKAFIASAKALDRLLVQYGRSETVEQGIELSSEEEEPGFIAVTRRKGRRKR